MDLYCNERKMMSMKRICAKLYMETHRIRCNRKFLYEPHPEGYLYSGGRFPTKIKAEDLPPWYVHGYMYKSYGFISARGVKHLLYKPDYTATNHLHKYDTLFISYNDEITPVELSNGFHWYTGYEHVLDGPIIRQFVTAAAQYSGYDVTEISKQLDEKQSWYHEHNK